MKKIIPLFIFFHIAAALFADKTNQKNVLFIIIDDLRPELGCYGKTHIRSPNIDRLAKYGVQFNRAYVQQANCASSRASFLSGVNMKTVGVDYPYSRYYVEEWLPSHDDLLTHFFKKDYYTLSIGKVHHTYPGYQLSQLSEPAFLPSETWRYADTKHQIPESPSYYIDKMGINTVAYEFVDAPDEAYKDGVITQETIKALDKLSDQTQPFFLAVGFLKPHLPFVAPKRFWDIYKNCEEVFLEGNSKLPPLDAPPYARKRLLAEFVSHEQHSVNTNEHAINQYQVSQPFGNNLRRAYFACVSFIDEQIGKILSKLEQLDIENETIIVLVGDHGFHIGENGMWGKFTNWEYSTRAPLIIYDPSNPVSGKCDSIVEFTDLYPTLTELAGIESPDFLEGTSLVPLLKDPSKDWKRAAFSQFPRGPKDSTDGLNLMGHSIRTKEYRYIEWIDTNDQSVRSRELYKYENAETESINLANDPSYQELCKSLSNELHLGWKGALPLGTQNESNNPVAPSPVPWGPEPVVWKLKNK